MLDKMTVYTDTERVFKELVSKGFTEEQASAVVEAIRSLELSQFATKTDLELALSQLRSDMNAFWGNSWPVRLG
jgi:hypothetical protein